LNETHVFFAGGGNTAELETFALNYNTKEWVLLESIPQDMPSPACGVLNGAESGQGYFIKHIVIWLTESSRGVARRG